MFASVQQAAPQLLCIHIPPLFLSLLYQLSPEFTYLVTSLAVSHCRTHARVVVLQTLQKI